MQASLLLCFVSLLMLLPPTQAASQKPSGATIFDQKCATCHRNTQRTLAPSIAQLTQLSRGYILRVLETGKMKSVGDGLTKSERLAVAEFLSASEPDGESSSAGDCTLRRKVVLNDPGWDSWGGDLANSRFAPPAVSSLSLADVPKLKLKWAFGFPGASATFGQPTVFGGRVFVGSEDGSVYSLDAVRGCIDWTFKAPATVKTAVTSGFGGRFVYFGDVDGTVYSVNASTGKLAWRVHVDSHPQSRITGSPVFYGGRLYVPVSSGEEGAAIDPSYPCCTFRGALVALDARTGKPLWESYTIPDTPIPTGRRNAAGTPLWGPSGAAVWSPPTIDTKKHVIYVATGNGYSGPPSSFTDSVIAFRMGDGKILWHRQMNGNDLWNISCVAPGKANCPADPGADFDFGAPPMLRNLPGGRRILIVAQKSGVVYGLDPDRDGQIVWKSRIGKGGPLGGIEWGGAASGNLLFFPLSDWDPNNPSAGGGMFALDLATGQKLWYHPPPPPACLKQIGCSPAQSSPPTLIPGVVFSGSEDGYLRAYNASTGALVWKFNVLQSFQTVNGLTAQGGSMNGSGPAIVNGMLYVQAGYTNNIPGNVLLAFSVDGK